MNWNKISAIAEIISSVAIVLTLIYLTIEILQNTQGMEANTRQSALNNAITILQMPVDDPELWLIATKPDLTDRERVKFSSWMHLTVSEFFYTQWRQWRAGSLDDQTWMRFEGPLVSELSSTNGRKWWEYFGPGLPREFGDHVDDLLEDVPVYDRMADVEAFD